MLAEAEPLVADADAAASAVDSQAKLDAPGTEAVPPFAAAARAVLAPNGDDALAERTTIPCDLCGEAASDRAGAGGPDDSLSRLCGIPVYAAN